MYKTRGYRSLNLSFWNPLEVEELPNTAIGRKIKLQTSCRNHAESEQLFSEESGIPEPKQSFVFLSLPLSKLGGTHTSEG